MDLIGVIGGTDDEDGGGGLDFGTDFVDGGAVVVVIVAGLIVESSFTGLSNERFNSAYTGYVNAFVGIARRVHGTKPRVNTCHPSVRNDLIAQSTTPL